jgi:hypothetical protein
MNKNIEALAQKEMTRKEFLLTVGFGILSIAGLSSLVKIFLGHHPLTTSSQNSYGYGSNPYGGLHR